MVTLDKDTIKTDAWKALYDVLKSSGLMTYINRIYSAYPAEFIEDAGGLPFAILHPADVVGIPVTLDNTKDYYVTFDIEVVVGEESEIAKKSKQVADIVNKVIMNAQDTLQTNGLFNYVMTGNTKDFDEREGNKIMYDVISIQFTFFGG